MKSPDKQIFSMLKAYNQSDVLLAIELYQDGILNKDKNAKQQLIADGWFPQKKAPVNQESYFFDGAYWVQSIEARQKKRKEIMKRAKKLKSKTDISLKGVKHLKCSVFGCNGSFYKQNICGGCKEGKKGFKIRLICDNNPDHEVLI